MGTGERRTASSLDDGQVDLRQDVVAVALEARVAGDAYLHVRIAGEAPVRARVPGPADTDPLAVVNPRGDLDLELFTLEREAGTPADGAGIFGHASGTAARRACLRADELAEDASGNLLELSVAVAGRAGDFFRSGLGALTVAPLARRRDLDLDGPRHAGERIGEFDPDWDSDVPAACAATSVAGEQIVPEEGREDVRQVREVEVARRVAAALEACVAVAVIQLARLGLGEHFVRLGNGPKAGLRVRLLRDVRMQLPRKLPKSLLDLGLGRRPLDAEQLVVVAFSRGHRARVPLALAVVVRGFDKAGELVGGCPHRANRLVVVHPHRAEQTDGPEHPRRKTIGRADE